MTEQELQQYLIEQYPKEDEGCEWKEFKNLKNDFSGHEKDDVISYVSALANMDGGHLVVGIEDKTLKIVGTDTYNYDVQKARLRLIDQCTNLPSEGLLVEEFITDDTHKTVWVIHVPRHMKRQPVYAHNKAWQRLDDSLIELTASRRNAILDEQDDVEVDWSAQVIPNAGMDDLDPRAIAKAREKFMELHPERETEIKGWDDVTFLNKAKLTIKGQITNSTIILLGREESEHFLSPAVCKIRWMRKKAGADENDEFRIFSIPMILAVDDVASKIKNATYTYTIEGNMFPDTLLRYDVFSIREPLCNAIAHQDYSLSARIEVVEYEDERLCFKNHGTFLPLSVESVVQNDFPESKYRNKFLVEAMRNVKMVETEGGGIRKLYLQQKKRFFPMPKYDLGGQTVVCEIEGRVLDENFAKILVNNPSLTLADIILLDKIQKHEHISDDSLSYLRKKKYVEGRKPNVYLSFSVVKQSKHVGLKTSYIKNKSFDDDYFKKLIIDYITNFGKATRQEITALLENKLPETLSKQQKFDKITNLLSSLKKKGIIKVVDRQYWVIAKLD